MELYAAGIPYNHQCRTFCDFCRVAVTIFRPSESVVMQVCKSYPVAACQMDTDFTSSESYFDHPRQQLGHV
jgi:hypothetical protein